MPPRKNLTLEGLEEIKNILLGIVQSLETAVNKSDTALSVANNAVGQNAELKGSLMKSDRKKLRDRIVAVVVILTWMVLSYFVFYKNISNTNTKLEMRNVSSLASNPSSTNAKEITVDLTTAEIIRIRSKGVTIEVKPGN